MLERWNQGLIYSQLFQLYRLWIELRFRLSQVFNNNLVWNKNTQIYTDNNQIFNLKEARWPTSGLITSLFHSKVFVWHKVSRCKLFTASAHWFSTQCSPRQSWEAKNSNYEAIFILLNWETSRKPYFPTFICKRPNSRHMRSEIISGWNLLKHISWDPSKPSYE